MRFQISCYLFLLVFLLSGIPSGAAQVTDQEVANIATKIGSVEKVEQLYSIRYTVGKYASRTDLTLRQQQLLMNSMKMLSDEFKMRNHFRNAADVYKDYLDYNNKYLISYNAFTKDSLMAVHKRIEENELATINALDAEIAALTGTRAAVSGLKTKYYSFGGFGAVGVIVLTLVISLSRNRAIRQAESQISTNREKLKAMHRNAVSAGMAEGTVTYCKETAVANIQILNSILDSVNQQEDKNLFRKETDALNKAISKLNSIAS